MDDMADKASLLQRAEFLASTDRLFEAKLAYIAAIQSDPSPATRNSYGCFLIRTECIDEAIEQFRQLFALTKGHRLQATVCNNLAVAYRESGNFEAAARWQQRSIAAEHEADHDIPGETEFSCDLSNLANDAIMAGNHDLAENLLQRSLTLELARGSRDGQASDCGSLGVLALLRGETPRALWFLWRAYRLHCQMRDMQGAGRDLLNLAHVGTQWGKHWSSVRFLHRAIRRFERAGARQMAARASQLLDEAIRTAEATSRDPLLN